MTSTRKQLLHIFAISVLLLQLFSFIQKETESNILASNIYSNLQKTKAILPQKDLFEKGLQGFFKLKKKGAIKKNILTVVDFRMSSNQKRLWVIDMDQQKVLFHSLVAHGRNSGNEYAKHFGNVPQSYKSSLGFYVTGDSYIGKHGLSLFLNGMEKGINDNAKKRAIVMHGAKYVSDEFIHKHGRLGRSYGCPSVPMKMHKEIITSIKGQSCLFLYFPLKKYEELSKFLMQ